MALRPLLSPAPLSAGPSRAAWGSKPSQHLIHSPGVCSLTASSFLGRPSLANLQSRISVVTLQVLRWWTGHKEVPLKEVSSASAFAIKGSAAPVPESVAQGPHFPMTLYTQHPVRQGFGVPFPFDAFKTFPSCQHSMAQHSQLCRTTRA